MSLTLAAILTAVYWLSYVDEQRVNAERRSMLASTARPILLNGFKPELRGVAIAARSAEMAAVDPRLPRLIVVVSDTCPGSTVAVPQWIDWIAHTPNRRYTAVIVSTEGMEHASQLAAALTARGVTWTSWRATQQEEFSFASGVSATPMLLAADGPGHVRVVSGVLTDATRNALDEFLGAEGRVFETQ